MYELFILAAMLTLTVGAFRRNSAPPRWLGWVSLAFAAGSVAFGAQIIGDNGGIGNASGSRTISPGCSLSHGPPRRESARLAEPVDREDCRRRYVCADGENSTGPSGAAGSRPTDWVLGSDRGADSSERRNVGDFWAAD